MAGGRGWDRWFLALAVPFGLLVAVGTPPMQELDAAAHLVRVHRIATGVLVEPVGEDGAVVPSIDGCLHGFLVHHGNRNLEDRALDLAGHWRAIPCTEETRWGITNASLTSPVPYLANAVGYGVAGALGGGVNARVLAARLSGLAVYLFAVWTAIRISPRGRSVLVAVGVLPSSLALAAGVAADATAIWSAILSVALVLRLRDQRSNHLLAALAASLAVLALSKNLYGPYLLLLLGLPAAAFRNRATRWRYVLGTSAAVVVVTGLWAAYVSSIRYLIPPFGIDSDAAAAYLVDHPLHLLRASWNALWHSQFREVTLPGFVEVLGGLRQPRVHHIYGDLAPLPLVGLAVAVLGVAVFADPGPPPTTDRTRPRLGWLIGAVVVTSVLLVFLGMALTANPPGAGTLLWTQGRYFLPLLPLLAFAAGTRRWSSPSPGRLVLAGSASLLVWVAVRVWVLYFAA